MILRNMLTSKLREYPVKINYPIKYDGVHVRNGLEVFAGEIVGTKHQVVRDHGDIRDFDIACLRYMLAVEAGPLGRQTMLYHILQYIPETIMYHLANVLHTDPEILRRELKIPEDIDLRLIPIANAVMVGRLRSYKLMTADLLRDAEKMATSSYVKKAHLIIKEHVAAEAKKRRKKWRAKK